MRRETLIRALVLASALSFLWMNRKSISDYVLSQRSANHERPEEYKCPYPRVPSPFPGEPDLCQLLTYCYQRHPAPSSVDDVQWVVDVYTEERMKNKTIEQVTKETFNVTLPNHQQDNTVPHSYPFLTGMGLRSFSDFAFETKEDIDNWAKDGLNSHMQDGSVLFLKPDILPQFVRQLLPTLTHTFIVVSANSIFAIPDKFPRESNELLGNRYLIRWFAKNALGHHEKLEAIPVGIYSRGPAYAHFFEKMEIALRTPPAPFYDPDDPASNSSRPNLMYINFEPKNNLKYRPQAIKTFGKMGVVETKVEMEHYLQTLKSSKFMLSPPGTGIDAYRTWEAILFNTIPVVWNSSLISLHRQSPSYVLDDYLHVSEEQFYKYKLPNKNRILLLAQYWFDRINSYRPGTLEH